MNMPLPGLPGPIVNALTVDVEDYFQVQALSERFPRPAWDEVPRRVEANVDRLLEMFASASVSATFFTLGWLAERHPAMVRRIASAGHELASHGYDHQRADRLSPAQLREDVRRSKRLIEDIGGCAVAGYRAPTFSIGPGNQWSYDILESEGYRYSSSLYPIRHDLYGAPDAPRFPFRPGRGDLWEMPLATRRLFGRNYPCAGGGYFRLLPYLLSRSNLRSVNLGERQPCIFYCHPWEIDAGQPRQHGLKLRSRIRHYTNIAAMPGRLERLLRDFAWGRLDQTFAPLAVPAAADRAALFAAG
ncbi:MAG TPA: XrtA system polysaccharide deacetylase [Stellaceae bacterium]|nr:XrtA system polysaccharide deacetylase [Stellaceae bacterium]